MITIIKRRTVLVFAVLLFFCLKIYSQENNYRLGAWHFGNRVYPVRMNAFNDYPIDDLFLKAGQIIDYKGQWGFKILAGEWLSLVKISKKMRVWLVFHYTVESAEDYKKMELFYLWLEKTIYKTIRNFEDRTVSVCGVVLNIEGRAVDETKIENICKNFNNRYKELIGPPKYHLMLALPQEYMEIFRYRHCFPYLYGLQILCYDHSYDFRNFRVVNTEQLIYLLNRVLKFNVKIYPALAMFGTVSEYDYNKKLLYPQIDIDENFFRHTETFKMVLQFDETLSCYELIRSFTLRGRIIKKGSLLLVRKPSVNSILKLAKEIDKNFAGKIQGMSFYSLPLKKSFSLTLTEAKEIFLRIRAWGI